MNKVEAKAMKARKHHKAWWIRLLAFQYSDKIWEVERVRFFYATAGMGLTTSYDFRKTLRA